MKFKTIDVINLLLFSIVKSFTYSIIFDIIFIEIRITVKCLLTSFWKNWFKGVMQMKYGIRKGGLGLGGLSSYLSSIDILIKRRETKEEVT